MALERHGQQDGAFQYIMASLGAINRSPFALRHHLDYDLGKKEQAGSYYQKAVELEPNNPIFVPLRFCFISSSWPLASLRLRKEYLMWLELVAEDKRGLVRLLGPRRYSTGVKLAITELGDAGLACEAPLSRLLQRSIAKSHQWRPTER